MGQDVSLQLIATGGFPDHKLYGVGNPLQTSGGTGTSGRLRTAPAGDGDSGGDGAPDGKLGPLLLVELDPTSGAVLSSTDMGLGVGWQASFVASTHMPSHAAAPLHLLT